MSQELSAVEKKILERIQTDFPISSDPYREIADSVSCSREETHRIVNSLRLNGIIRRIGGVYVPDKLGYKSCLVACKVDPKKLERVAAQASAFNEVTHNYEREGVYNLWFTVIAETDKRINEIVQKVGKEDGVKSIHSLPSLRTFKIKVNFSFSEK